MDLTGKVAIVTGSGRGLGLAYARALAAAGACVVVNDVDADAAEQAVAETAAGPGGRRGGRRSATPRPPSGSSTRAVDEFGRLDVMVTNAGVLRDRVLWKMTDDEFDTVDPGAPARYLHLCPGRRAAACASRARAAG